MIANVLQEQVASTVKVRSTSPNLQVTSYSPGPGYSKQDKLDKSNTRLETALNLVAKVIVWIHLQMVRTV